MTANALAKHRKIAQKAGMDDYIAKPINERDMFSTMAKWIKPSGLIKQKSKNLVKSDEIVEEVTEIPELECIDTRWGLAIAQDNKALYRRLLGMFYDGQKDFVERFRQVWDEGDMRALERSAHTLKGVSGNIGARKVQETAYELEKVCHERRPETEIEVWLDKVEKTLLPVLTSLENLTEVKEKANGNKEQIDTEELKTRLKELAQLLIRSDTIALDLVRTMPELGGVEEYHAQLEELKTKVHGYEFDEALEQIEKTDRQDVTLFQDKRMDWFEVRVAQEKDKPIVLVVDDIPDNIEVLRWALLPEYQVMAATNGKKALRIAHSNPRPDLILLDIMMPDIDGYEVCSQLKRDPRTAQIPVIFLTAKGDSEDEKKGLEIGAVDYVLKPIKPSIVQARVRTHLELYDQNRQLGQQVKKRTLELQETRLEITQRLGRAAEFRDNETGLHVIRMGHYSRLIAEALDVGEEWADLILHAAPMHDVGKIGIPDKILLKPGKLDPDEWEIMKTHTTIGGEILSGGTSRLMEMSQSIAVTHHEKWDGSGYPKELKKDQIPLEGRIVAVADVFDALTSDRPYKKAWPAVKAIASIEKESGKHFDPQVVKAFKTALPRYSGN